MLRQNLPHVDPRENQLAEFHFGLASTQHVACEHWCLGALARLARVRGSLVSCRNFRRTQSRGGCVPRRQPHPQRPVAELEDFAELDDPGDRCGSYVVALLHRQAAIPAICFRKCFSADS